MNKGLIKEAKAIINLGLSYHKGVVLWDGSAESTVVLHLIREMFEYICWPVLVVDTKDIDERQLNFIKNMQNVWEFKELTTIVENPNFKNAVSQHLNDFRVNFIIDGSVKTNRKPPWISIKGEVVNLRPIINWSSKDIWTYLYDNDVPYCSIYSEKK